MNLLNAADRKAINDTANHYLFSASNIGDAELLLSDALAELSDPQIINISPIKGRIGIDSIRDKKTLLSLKRGKNEALIIAIHGAHTMTLEAQNSILKTLEESTAGLRFMLSSDSSGSLLPTIRSRLNTISYTPPKIDGLSVAEQGIYRASGYSYSVLKSYQTSELSQLDEAKKWLAAKKDARVKLLGTIKTKEEATALIGALLMLLYGLQGSSSNNQDKAKTKQLVASIDLTLSTLGRISVGGNIRLNMTQLALGL